MTNPAIATDFYKTNHHKMFPNGTTEVYSNFTPRSSKLANKLQGIFDDKIVFFGLQAFIKEYLIDDWNENFFKKPKAEVIAEFSRIISNAVGPDAERDDKMAALHDLGYLPIKIKALPEGSLVNMRVPVMTIVNTHPEFFWLTNYLETVMSAALWKASTSATTAYQYRRLLERAAEKTGGDKNFVLWQGHDFSYRGMSGTHDACVSGAGHLTSFLGTDTIPAIEFLEKYYSGKDTFVAGSVPASEHSVTTSTIVYNVNGGMTTEEAELAFIKNMITQQYPSGIVSLVADSFDYWTVLSSIAPALKSEILSRTPDALGNAKVVFRPDSGDPVEIICGRRVRKADSVDDAVEILVDEERETTPHGECGNSNPSDIFVIDGKTVYVEASIFWNRYDKQYYYEDGHELETSYEVSLSAEDKGSIEVLWDTFGGTVNDKGFKVLNPRVGLIYGDSITLQRADEIVKRLEEKGFASTNVVFGIGSYTYQYATRDSFGFAVKCTNAVVNGEEVDVYKEPKTDNGTKRSARGLLRVEKEGDDFVLYDRQTRQQEEKGALVEVFKDSKLIVEQTLAQIRGRLS